MELNSLDPQEQVPLRPLMIVYSCSQGAFFSGPSFVFWYCSFTLCCRSSLHLIFRSLQRKLFHMQLQICCIYWRRCVQNFPTLPSLTPSVNLLIVFHLKSVLSYKTTPALFWFPFDWNIFFSYLFFEIMCVLEVEVASVGSIQLGLFSIRLATLCLLIRELIHLHLI